MKPYIVTTEHGEHDTLYHIVDRTAPDDFQPCIVATVHAHGSYRNGCIRGGRAEALRRCAMLNHHDEVSNQ